jgi:hypothetical protein
VTGKGGTREGKLKATATARHFYGLNLTTKTRRTRRHTKKSKKIGVNVVNGIDSVVASSYRDY